VTEEESDSDDEWAKYDYGETSGTATAPRCSQKAVMAGLQKNLFAIVT
jgi:hypothetical protein